MMSPAMVYRIFQRVDGGAPSVRTVVIALVTAAALVTAIGVIRVKRQHEVLLLGFRLSRASEQVGRMHEAHRQLELELATLTSPDRIRGLATQLGMQPVSPDRIRAVPPPPEFAWGQHRRTLGVEARAHARAVQARERAP